MLERPSDKLLKVLLSQYHESPNFIKYLKVYANACDKVHDALAASIVERYYDRAHGAQLDVIGLLVGANRRVLEGTRPVPFFGYVGSVYDPPTRGAGSDADLSIGGILSSDNGLPVSDFVLNDVQYRNWINARILKNKSRCTIEDMIAFIHAILGDDTINVEISEPANATIQIHLHTTLGQLEKTVVIERLGHTIPIGVAFTVSDDAGTIDVKRTGSITT